MTVTITMEDRKYGKSIEKIEVSSQEELDALIKKERKQAKYMPISTTIIMSCLEIMFFKQIL